MIRKKPVFGRDLKLEAGFPKRLAIEASRRKIG
jgi:hypothetical protein